VLRSSSDTLFSDALACRDFREQKTLELRRFRAPLR